MSVILLLNHRNENLVSIENGENIQDDSIGNLQRGY
jgi:hypothetical protein